MKDGEGILAPETIIPIDIFVYSESKVIVFKPVCIVPTAVKENSPSLFWNGKLDGFEVLLVGYSKCFIPAESTQLILV